MSTPGARSMGMGRMPAIAVKNEVGGDGHAKMIVRL